MDRKSKPRQKNFGAPRSVVSFRLSTEMEICFPICLRSGLLHVLLPDRCQEVQYSWPHSFVGKSCRVEMVLLPICSLPHMHSNVLFLSANCVEVRHSRSWNEATSRRRTSQMLRLIPLRPGKVWNRRWYHVGISTMWFCTCTEYRAQYQYMSYYMVRFIYIYIVIVYTVGMGLQHESEFHSPQGASFHQGGSLLHIPKLSLCSLVCMQTFFEAPWVNLFFFWMVFLYICFYGMWVHVMFFLVFLDRDF